LRKVRLHFSFPGNLRAARHVEDGLHPVHTDKLSEREVHRCVLAGVLQAQGGGDLEGRQRVACRQLFPHLEIFKIEITDCM